MAVIWVSAVGGVTGRSGRAGADVDGTERDLPRLETDARSDKAPAHSRVSRRQRGFSKPPFNNCAETGDGAIIAASTAAFMSIELDFEMAPLAGRGRDPVFLRCMCSNIAGLSWRCVFVADRDEGFPAAHDTLGCSRAWQSVVRRCDVIC